MVRLSHSRARLSMLALFASVLLPAAPVAAAGGPAKSSPYYGRWTVSEERPVFSSRGRLYKMFDIAPCGKDFCGVSVADNGKCGARLFRFLAKNASGETTLHGHGKWGTARKNIQINTWEDSDSPGGRVIELYLGDGHDFGERSDNMPTFNSSYRPTGKAQCLVG